MATAEELLNSEEIAARTFSINSDLRTVTPPANFKVFGVESDDDVARIYFKGPRFYKGVDLSTFRVRVNILNANADPDGYSVDDLQVDNSTDTIVFSWLIGRNTAQYDGEIKFSLCFRELDENAYVIREFNTTIARGQILEGLETTTLILQKYPDLIDNIILRLENLEENGIPASSLDTTLSVSGKAADAKAVGDKIAEMATAGRLVVTANMIDNSSGTASHNSTEIIEHLNAGGDVVLKLMPVDIYAEIVGFYDTTVFFNTTDVSTNAVTQRNYGIYENKTVVVTEEVLDAGLTDEQADQIQANTDAIEALPIKVADDGYTDISGIRQLTNFAAIKEDDVITLNYTLQGDKQYTDAIELDTVGRPIKITTPYASFDVTWEGF